MLKEFQTGHDPVFCWCLSDLVREHREFLLGYTVQNILFIEIMGIEGGTTNPCPIQNILHQNLIVGFFSQEFSKGGTHQAIRALGTTICCVDSQYSRLLAGFGESARLLVLLRILAYTFFYEKLLDALVLSHARLYMERINRASVPDHPSWTPLTSIVQPVRISHGLIAKRSRDACVLCVVTAAFQARIVVRGFVERLPLGGGAFLDLWSISQLFEPFGRFFELAQQLSIFSGDIVALAANTRFFERDMQAQDIFVEGRTTLDAACCMACGIVKSRRASCT
jgi:hypothetical protein